MRKECLFVFALLPLPIAVTRLKDEADENEMAHVDGVAAKLHMQDSALLVSAKTRIYGSVCLF